jgi:Cdc6-like AAA superfamily ATPase
MQMIVTIFDNKKGLRIKDTLKTLPRQNIVVLDSICNLFDDCGEEKSLGFELLFREVHANCKKNSIEMIDQKQMVQCMEELEHYGFIEILKATKKAAKDVKSRKFKLKVDLHELCTELD